MNPVTYKINSKKVDKSEVEEIGKKKVNDVQHAQFRLPSMGFVN
jgi:hypothetical protein